MVSAKHANAPLPARRALHGCGVLLALLAATTDRARRGPSVSPIPTRSPRGTDRRRTPPRPRAPHRRRAGGAAAAAAAAVRDGARRARAGRARATPPDDARLRVAAAPSDVWARASRHASASRASCRGRTARPTLRDARAGSPGRPPGRGRGARGADGPVGLPALPARARAPGGFHFVVAAGRSDLVYLGQRSARRGAGAAARARGPRARAPAARAARRLEQLRAAVLWRELPPRARARASSRRPRHHLVRIEDVVGGGDAAGARSRARAAGRLGPPAGGRGRARRARRVARGALGAHGACARGRRARRRVVRRAQAAMAPTPVARHAPSRRCAAAASRATAAPATPLNASASGAGARARRRGRAAGRRAGAC